MLTTRHLVTQQTTGRRRHAPGRARGGEGRERAGEAGKGSCLPLRPLMHGIRLHARAFGQSTTPVTDLTPFPHQFVHARSNGDADGMEADDYAPVGFALRNVGSKCVDGWMDGSMDGRTGLSFGLDWVNQPWGACAVDGWTDQLTDGPTHLVPHYPLPNTTTTHTQPPHHPIPRRPEPLHPAPQRRQRHGGHDHGVKEVGRGHLGAGAQP